MESHGLRIENTDFKSIADRCMEKARGGNVVEFKSEHQTQRINDLETPKAYKDCSFDNFKGNEKLIEELNKLITSDGIVLRGNTGCGKTHLAIAMGKLIPAEWRSTRSGGLIPGAIFTTAPELLLKIRSSFQDGAGQTEEGLIDYYSGCSLLILDDLGSEKTSEFAVTTLYIILDRRLRDCRKTIITTNLNKEEIDKTFGARIASRLAGMENIKINMPDYRKKRS